MSLRDQQRLAIQRAVQAAAVRLFLVRGFDAVTIEEVAVAAEVSASTVYRRFGTKEALVVWDERDSVLEAALRRSVATLPPLAALEAALTEAYTLGRADERALRRRAALIDATPALAAFQVAELDRAHGQLVRGLATAYRRSPDELELDLAVRVAFAALLAALGAWQRSRSSVTLARWLTASFDAARRAVAADSRSREVQPPRARGSWRRGPRRS